MHMLQMVDGILAQRGCRGGRFLSTAIESSRLVETAAKSSTAQLSSLSPMESQVRDCLLSTGIESSQPTSDQPLSAHVKSAYQGTLQIQFTWDFCVKRPKTEAAIASTIIG